MQTKYQEREIEFHSVYEPFSASVRSIFRLQLYSKDFQEISCKDLDSNVSGEFNLLSISVWEPG